MATFTIQGRTHRLKDLAELTFREERWLHEHTRMTRLELEEALAQIHPEAWFYRLLQAVQADRPDYREEDLEGESMTRLVLEALGETPEGRERPTVAASEAANQEPEEPGPEREADAETTDGVGTPAKRGNQRSRTASESTPG